MAFFMGAIQRADRMLSSGCSCFQSDDDWVYIINTAKNIAQADVNEIVEKVGTIYLEGSEVIMTIADIWREEGIRKGEAQGVRKVALEMLRKGFTVELVPRLLIGMLRKSGK